MWNFNTRPPNIILLVSMRTHGQAGGCSRSEGFEVAHSTPSLPALWLQPATLSSWASFLSSVKKNGMWSKPEDCRAHSWVQLVHSWSSLNFGFHIIIVPFYKWRNARLRKQRGLPWGYTASWPFVWTEAHIPTPKMPCALNFYSTTYSLGKKQI